MGAVEWGPEIATIYDHTIGDRNDPEVVSLTVDVLADLAGDEPTLEFAVGTGRVALPLAARGIDVHGVELSPAMVDVLRAKPGGADVAVTIGDMATTRVPGEFSLVYLVFNTITNLTTQDEQVAVFQNAADHLRAGGRFLIEVGVPEVRRVTPAEPGRLFQLDDDHVGVETFDDDPSTQLSWSHHWMDVDGSVVRHSAPYRYVWPAEGDLMARIAGLRLRHRWSDWDRSPFGAGSTNHIAVYERVA